MINAILRHVQNVMGVLTKKILTTVKWKTKNERTFIENIIDF